MKNLLNRVQSATIGRMSSGAPHHPPSDPARRTASGPDAVPTPPPTFRTIRQHANERTYHDSEHHDQSVHLDRLTDRDETIDTSSLESLSFDDDASSKSSSHRYKLTIDENVVEKISSLAAQKVDGIIDMKGNVRP